MVVEAHAVPSDPHRRERYDLGDDEDGMNGGGGAGLSDGGFGMNPADVEEILLNMATG